MKCFASFGGCVVLCAFIVCPLVDGQNLQAFASPPLIEASVRTEANAHRMTHEYIEEIEKDYPLRHLKPLEVTHAKGDLIVQGWSFDKVRVKIRKRTLVDSPMKAKQLFSSIDYRFNSSEKSIEVSSQYGKGLSIEERLRDKVDPRVNVEMFIFAPSNLKLQLWAVSGKVSLKNWNAPADIRSNAGIVRVEGFRGNLISVLCEQCTTQFKQVRGSVRSISGKGSIDLNDVQGKSIFVETVEGPIRLFEVKGDQLYASKQGSIEGQFLSGKIEFQSESSNINFKEITGFLSGYVEKGAVRAHIKEWQFLDQGMIESLSGDISLSLPRQFSASVDVWSKQGQTEIGFPLSQISDSQTVGPQPLNRLTGRIREGGPLLRVFSESGNIKILRDPFL